MPISMARTPNPDAMKFEVGVDVGGPVTYTDGETAEVAADVVRAIFAAGPVKQVSLTSDFVSVTKHPDADWQQLAPAVLSVIEAAYGE